MSQINQFSAIVVVDDGGIIGFRKRECVLLRRAFGCEVMVNDGAIAFWGVMDNRFILSYNKAKQ